MKATSIAALLFLPLLVSCGAKESRSRPAASYCGVAKGTDMDPCQVSVYTLAAHPDYFDGKVVRITGFYSKGLDDVLFFDRDSSENAIFKNSVALLSANPENQEKLTKKLNRFVGVVGKFTQTVNSPGEFSGRSYGQFLGTLNVLDVGSVYDSSPYACWEPHRDRSKDPKTVRGLLGEVVCDDTPPPGPVPKPD